MTRQERWVDVPGARLWVAADGDGPPIVLLHAGIVDARVWEPFVPLLAREGYRVIWFDARGFGRSATDDVEFRRVDDLLAVLDALDIRRAALVGNSQGGITALASRSSTPIAWRRSSCSGRVSAGARSPCPSATRRSNSATSRSTPPATWRP